MWFYLCDWLRKNEVRKNEKISKLILLVNVAFEHVLAQPIQKMEFGVVELSLPSLLPVVERFLEGFFGPKEPLDGHFPVVCAKKVLDFLRISFFLWVVSEELVVIPSEVMRLILPLLGGITGSQALNIELSLFLTVLSSKKRPLLCYRWQWALDFVFLIFEVFIINH